MHLELPVEKRSLFVLPSVLIRRNLYLGLILQLSFGVGDVMLRGENQPWAGKIRSCSLIEVQWPNNYVHA